MFTSASLIKLNNIFWLFTRVITQNIHFVIGSETWPEVTRKQCWYEAQHHCSRLRFNICKQRRDVSERLFCQPNQQILKTSQQFAVVFMGRKTFLFWTRHQDIFQPRLWWENQVKWSFPNQNWVEFGLKPNQTVLSQQKVKNETYRKMKLQYNKCKDYVCGLQNHLIRWLLTFPWNIIWSFEYMMCPHTM